MPGRPIDDRADPPASEGRPEASAVPEPSPGRPRVSVVGVLGELLVTAGVLILLFLGLQFRMVDTIVLNEPVSQVVRRQSQAAAGQPLAFAQRLVTPQLHAVRPPKYIGWVLLSVGGVLVLQSFAMAKPGQ